MDKNEAFDQMREMIEQRRMRVITEKIPEKIICVTKYLGKPVVSNGVMPVRTDHNGDCDAASYFDHTQVLSSDDIGSSKVIGWRLCRLGAGTNLELVVMTGDPLYSESYNESSSLEIKAVYNGKSVFVQEDGTVHCYYPTDEWENMLGTLYVTAEQLEKAEKKESALERKKEAREKYEGFWRQLKNLWNY